MAAQRTVKNDLTPSIVGGLARLLEGVAVGVTMMCHKRVTLVGHTTFQFHIYYRGINVLLMSVLRSRLLKN